MKKVWKLFLNSLSILSVIILICFIIYIMQITVFHQKYGQLFGYTVFNVKTGSMLPVIEPGDGVLVKLDKDIKVNDIVVYEEKDSMIAHRVESMNSDTIITKGDNNNVSDPPFLKEKVQGKVIRIFPKLGKVQDFLKRPYVFITILDVIIITTIISNYYDKKKKIN